MCAEMITDRATGALVKRAIRAVPFRDERRLKVAAEELTFLFRDVLRNLHNKRDPLR